MQIFKWPTTMLEPVKINLTMVIIDCGILQFTLYVRFGSLYFTKNLIETLEKF